MATHILKLKFHSHYLAIVLITTLYLYIDTSSVSNHWNGKWYWRSL